ncbi:hypothetical protein V8G54_016334 [Vigna mungo]|uniref:Uncharacterized protein n=1 Tax=Vigna mungo TaxID=3915 RepID=A0AAQ3NK07_VIGMU
MGRVSVIAEEPEHEVEGSLAKHVVETCFRVLTQLIFDLCKGFTETVSKKWEKGVFSSGESLEEEVLDEFVVGLRRVEVGTDAEAAGELGGGHESAVEDVELLDFIVVEQYRKGGPVQQRNDTRIGGDEGSRWHVCADDGGVVAADSGSEELVAALVVEVVVAVEYGSEEWEAVASRDFSQRTVVGIGGERHG